MNAIRRVFVENCILQRYFLYTTGKWKIKGSEPSVGLFCPQKLHSLRKQYFSQRFPLATLKCCCLALGKIEKAYKVRNYFFYTIDRISTIFSNLETGAQPKLQHANYIFPLSSFRLIAFWFLCPVSNSYSLRQVETYFWRRLSFG